jgi:proteic killer suppression protein
VGFSQGAPIDIAWSNRKLGKCCATDAAGRKRFGAARWKLLKKRLFVLAAVPALADLRGSAGFHPLRADRAGQYALALDGPYRLVFRPDHDPIPMLRNGRVDEAAVTRVIVLEVVDYHG